MGIIRLSKVVARRLATMVRQSERTPPGHQGGGMSPLYKPYPDQEVAFELAEDMPESHGPDDEYSAYLRPWDPSQHAGKGAYVTGTDTIDVRDIREVGYYGDTGHKGTCKIRFDSTGKRFGEITDMECP